MGQTSEQNLAVPSFYKGSVKQDFLISDTRKIKRTTKFR